MAVEISSLRPGDRVQIEAVVAEGPAHDAGVYISFDDTIEPTVFVPNKAIASVEQRFRIGDVVRTGYGYDAKIVLLRNREAIVEGLAEGNWSHVSTNSLKRADSGGAA